MTFFQELGYSIMDVEQFAVVKYCDTETKAAVPVSDIPKLKLPLNPLKAYVIKDPNGLERTGLVERIFGM